MDIVIVDYGKGNILSIKRSFSALGVNTVCSRQRDIIENAKALVMPGVGHFKTVMNFLNDSHLDVVLNRAVLEKKVPVLGICLGMHIMTNHSEEGDVEGLGWVDTSVVKIIPNNRKIYKVPNIGWCLVNKNPSSTLLDGIDCDTSPFYFSHSYAIRKGTVKNLVATSFDYEDKYVAMFESRGIYGTQFHPEKSHLSGTDLISNFLSRVRQ